MIVEAFPVTLFKRQMPDNSRKYIEIFEATGVKDGQVIGNTIFQFIPTKTNKDKGKILEIQGDHKRVGQISERIKNLLLLNGEDEELVEKYTTIRKENAM